MTQIWKNVYKTQMKQYNFDKRKQQQYFIIFEVILIRQTKNHGVYTGKLPNN